MRGHRRESAAWPKRRGRLAGPDVRVQPMPGGKGGDNVEGLTGERPLFEGCVDDLDRADACESLTRDVGEGRSELDGNDRGTQVGQRLGGLPGPASDLKDAAAWLQRGHFGQVGEQLWRVSRANPIVELSVLVEGRSQSSALVRIRRLVGLSPAGHGRAVPAFCVAGKARWAA
jgi:hypothetical protein